ncbi:MAG: hypothetical protein J6386_13335 [Candidatus Synoicihabitans palmerolidicus]|nr:hypothetical protein [Candidatus Synoicihabitans palmerolidicus]
MDFELELIGSLQRETGTFAHRTIQALQACGRPIHYHGWQKDEQVQAAYQRCSFTVYLSLL